MDYLLMLALAVGVDLLLGDPPDAAHPVAWMGKLVTWLQRLSPARRPLAQFIYGMGIVLITAGVFTAAAYYLLFYLKGVSYAAYIIAGGLLLKSTFSIRGLQRAALKVKGLLQEGELGAARHELRSLVSRDTSDLPPPLLVSAAVESVAESSGDGLVAPLFYSLLLGVPGAIAYRAVNTCDSMIGYHGEYEYLGKFAARLDDALNYLPARLAALLLVLAACLWRQDWRAAWRAARLDHSAAESPNAGWPMAAAAGALNVQLEKVGHYRLGTPGALLGPQTISAALGLSRRAMLAWVALCFIAGGIRFAVTT